MKKFYPFLIALVLAMSLAGAAFAIDTLVVADQYYATTLDPIGHNDYPTSRACSHIYDTLVFLNPDGTLRPGLAEKWEFLSDTAYKMYLRKGVKFHNGDEMTAEDVKYMFHRDKMFHNG